MLHLSCVRDSILWPPRRRGNPSGVFYSPANSHFNQSVPGTTHPLRRGALSALPCHRHTRPHSFHLTQTRSSGPSGNRPDFASLKLIRLRLSYTSMLRIDSRRINSVLLDIMSRFSGLTFGLVKEPTYSANCPGSR
jgi:hypothetical protein